MTHELTKEEFKEVFLRFRPGATDKEYDQEWDDFCDRKENRERMKSVLRVVKDEGER